MLRRSPLLLVIVLVLAPAPARAATAPPLRDTGVRGAVGLFGDGERLIGVLRREGMTVLDAATGRRWSLTTPPGCDPAAVGGGAAAFACSQPGDLTGGGGVVVDLASGTRHRLPALPSRLFGTGTARVNGVGRRWVGLRVSGYHFGFDVFVHRQTGRLVRRRPAGEAVPDLDARGVWRPLCRPLRVRRWYGQESGMLEAGAPYAYRRPFGATLSDPSEHGDTVLVERCGRARALLAYRCVDVVCSRPLLAPGVVAWSVDEPGTTPPQPTRLRAFLPRSGRTLSWRVESFPRFAVTRRRVWVLDSGRLLSAKV